MIQGYVFCVSVPYLTKVLIYIYYHVRIVSFKKYQSQQEKNRRSSEMACCIFETYKNSVMTHGRHIYQAVSEMDMTTMCAYQLSQHALTPWKFLFR